MDLFDITDPTTIAVRLDSKGESLPAVTEMVVGGIVFAVVVAGVGFFSYLFLTL